MTEPILPTVEACDEALNALGELFDSLPQSHRPLQAGNREDIRRIIQRIRRYIIAQGKVVGDTKEHPRAPLSSEGDGAKGSGDGVKDAEIVGDEGDDEPDEAAAQALPKGNAEQTRVRSKAELKKALGALRQLFDAIMALEHDEDRAELFDRLLEACCTRCGAKVKEDQEHDCPYADDDDDDEDEDGDGENEDGEDEDSNE